MKKSIVFFLFVLFACSHKTIEYKTDGKIDSVEVYNRKGKLDGLKIVYYSNEAVLMTANYKDGKLDGDYIEYFPSGEILSRAHFRNGKQRGLKVRYFRNGNLDTRITYSDDGNRIGSAISYYSNGKFKKYNCFAFDGLNMYVLSLDSNSNVIKEEGKSFDESFHVLNNFDSVKVNESVFSFEILVSKPPFRRNIISIYELSKEGKKINVQTLESDTFVVKVNRRFDQTGLNHLYVVGKVYNQKDDCIIKDSIDYSVNVVK